MGIETRLWLRRFLLALSAAVVLGTPAWGRDTGDQSPASVLVFELRFGCLGLLPLAAHSVPMELEACAPPITSAVKVGDLSDQAKARVLPIHFGTSHRDSVERALAANEKGFWNTTRNGAINWQLNSLEFWLRGKPRPFGFPLGVRLPPSSIGSYLDDLSGRNANVRDNDASAISLALHWSELLHGADFKNWSVGSDEFVTRESDLPSNQNALNHGANRKGNGKKSEPEGIIGDGVFKAPVPKGFGFWAIYLGGMLLLCVIEAYLVVFLCDRNRY